MNKTTFKSCFYLLLFSYLPCSAQWHDYFDDSDFRRNPVWVGDTSHFEINSVLKLHLNAPATSGKSYLSTHSEITSDAVWKFQAQLDFNSSASNYAKVYLMSDKARLDSSLNGYYLRIGGTDDDISLYRQTGTSSRIIIDGRNGMVSADHNNLSFQVTRTSQGVWTLNCDTSGLVNYSVIGSGTDSTFWHSYHFGVQCIYSATRSNKFFFDNFSVSGKRTNDTIPPVIKKVEVETDTVISIHFSEDINCSSLTNSHFGGISLKRIEERDKKTLILYLTSALQCRAVTEINISAISDLSRNELGDTTVSVSYCAGEPFDVIITEIMADPEPAVYLPEVEFLELHNTSDVSINLNKWKLQIGDDQKTFPPCFLPPDNYLILCSSKGCSQFTGMKNCLELLSSGSLNNAGEYISLRNSKGELIHWVTYDEAFYHDELKKTGGWSMEMIDLASPCLGRENWKASINENGGSPGKVNSVIGTVSDLTEFHYLNFYLPDESTLRLYFSKALDAKSISKDLFTIESTSGQPFRIVLDSIQHQFVDLIFSEGYQANTTYSLQLSGEIRSCSGTNLGSSRSVTFMRPEKVVKNDILINEVLFDALPGNQEFIELYNNSNKFVNSSDLRIAYRSSSNVYESAFSLGEYPFVINPNSFMLLAANSLNEQENTTVTCKNFPALHNTEGCIALMNSNYEVLDELCYSEKMHFPLLVNKSGVSLERVRYDSPTSIVSNWHSASSTEGYSTPGRQNSQFLEETNSDKEITLEFEIFSPDNDGYKDIQTIFYQLSEPGFVANIIVFDAMGRRVKILANNQVLGTNGSFTWDGIDDDGKMASTGIYLIFIKLHHPNGVVKQYRKTCVLGGNMRR